LFALAAICTTIFYVHLFTDISFTSNYRPWPPLANHCPGAQPISESEFLQRQDNLAKLLYDRGASAYVAEPGANTKYFGNISEASWHLSERPLLLMISPTFGEAAISAKVTIITPAFEEPRARLLPVPGADVTYISWEEDEDPFAIALHALPAVEGPIYVDGMIRNFIADGLQKAVSGARVLTATSEITQLRERKSPAELDLLKCANEVGG